MKYNKGKSTCNCLLSFLGRNHVLGNRSKKRQWIYAASVGQQDRRLHFLHSDCIYHRFICLGKCCATNSYAAASTRATLLDWGSTCAPTMVDILVGLVLYPRPRTNHRLGSLYYL